MYKMAKTRLKPGNSASLVFKEKTSLRIVY